MKRMIRRSHLLLGTLAIILTAGCTTTKLANQPSAPSGAPQQAQPYKVGKPYQVDGVWYYPKVDMDYDETGIASWYGPGFHGQYTANGEVYDQNGLTAAHKTLPLPSMVRVTNLDNGRSIEVRVNDRGPFVNGRIIDLTRRDAQLLGFIDQGTAKVRVQVMKEESMALAALGSSQGGENAGPKPLAAPSGSVSATPLPPIGKSQPPSAPSPAPQPRATQTAAVPPTKSVIGQTIAPQPDGKVQLQPVRATNIYIQAGAFTRQSNAQLLTSKLSAFGPVRMMPVQVGNQLFYRVRLGPLADVDQADQVLQRVIHSGQTEARIVVD
ncbi:MAG TPA: septal ring lytic transglycosylase RlpA family protein [Dongiaceae bacterium]|nr:septal ring lytic transglycosylase RlpA family protein [Dongiaceae bacterium]